MLRSGCFRELAWTLIISPQRSWQCVDVIEPDSDDPNPLTAEAMPVKELELLEALDRARPDPLRQVIAREKLAEVWEVATPTERKYIELLDRFHVQNSLPMDETHKAIAEVLGVTVNAVHQMRSRFVRKFKD